MKPEEYEEITEDLEQIKLDIDVVIQKLEDAEGGGITPPVEPPIDPEPPIEPEPPVEPPVEPEIDPGHPIPATGERIRVPNSEALTKLLSKHLEPGITLALHAASEFNDTYNVKSPGVYIVGESAADDRLTKSKGRFNLVAAWGTVRGIDFTGTGRKVEIWGAGNRVNRCRFTNVVQDGIIYLMGGKHAKVVVDRCEFRNFKGAAIRGELKDISQAKDMDFHRNLFKNHSTSGDNESVIIILTDQFNSGNTRYRRNLFDTCMQNNNTGQSELITVKIGGAGVSECTVINTRGFFSLRVSNNARVANNWMGKNSYIKVFGDNHQITNNFGEDQVLEINRGDAYASDPCPERCRNFGLAGRAVVVWDGHRCKGAHASTRKAVAVNNEGRIHLGNANDARYGYIRQCKEIVLRGNKTKAVRFGTWTDVKETDVGEGQCTAKKLTEADVGIKA